MLCELRVENVGIVDEVLVAFGPGLTAITGETGAGKTLLIDALELLTGGRAEPSIVRDGAAEARVEGRFLAGDDEWVLARVVPVAGRSRAYVNGRLATASELGELGRRLLDLHGQHAHQSLLASAEQRDLLDRFAGPPAQRALARLLDARGAVRRIEAELAALGGDERARAREIDLLRYQCDEIEQAAVVDADEDIRLAAEEEILADAEAHRDALTQAYSALQDAATDAVGEAVGALGGRAPFAALAARIHGLQAEVAEASHDVRATLDGVVVDPARLDALQQRRARLHELTRKYGPTLGDVVAYGAEARTRLGDLERHEERAAALERERADSEAAANVAARTLSEVRRAAAPELAAAVTGHLRALAMPKAVFGVVVEDASPTDHGADDVTFMLAANPGETARPLARAASGGELSRAMLALRLVLSEAPPTLVFDEVDAGIGGEAGTAIGAALAQLGARHQVLCVTHLSQVAAHADAHLAVAKLETDGRTVARAELLLDAARVGELARMLGGRRDSTNAQRHARELLADARRAREAVRT